MVYTEQEWVNDSVAPPAGPISAARLAYIEAGVKAAHDLIGSVGGGSGGSIPWVVVASNDAPAAVKAAAAYVCDGVNDEVQINAAIDLAAPLQSRNSLSPSSAQQRGTVLLSGGRFVIQAPILMRTGVTLAGSGELTQVTAVNLTSTAGYPTGVAAVIKHVAATDHAMTVRDLWIEGNFAAGGQCHGIVWAGPGGNAAGYPSTSPDPSNHVRDVRLANFTTGTRHGLWLQNNLRAGHYHNLWIRECSGNGVFADGTPDSVLTASDIGGCATGVRIEGANWRVNGVKTYYCGLIGGTGIGFAFGSGRHTIVGIESQDDQYGVQLSGIKNTLAGVTVDCAGTTAFEVSGSRNSINGLAVYQRAGGRFGTTVNGIVITGSPTYCQLVGWVEKTNGGTITNPFVGTLGTASFQRISDDNFGLRSVG